MSDTMCESIKLENREVIELISGGKSRSIGFLSPESIRHFGVALTVDEAQEFIAREYRVFGDEYGPFLVIRLKASQALWAQLFFDGATVTVEFAPLMWRLHNETGIICWLEKLL
jgi:hypothetical protein